MTSPTSSANTIISRFATSPTGYLHVGGARTALFAWLVARHSGGKFLLRIEDTDLARSTEQACQQLLEDLRWLGLRWDNDGPGQLVLQSSRKAVYDAIIDGMIARGQAYRAYESNEELAAMRKAAEKEKKAFVYRRPAIPEDQVRQYERENRPHVVRFAMPVKEYRFTDVVLQKDVTLPADEAQDFVIRKTDGMPTYHFAVVVDDAEMGITHVLRGQEHLKNTFNHIALQEALGYARPVYAHLTTILNPDNSKMGKRDRDKAIRAKTQVWIKSRPGSSVEQVAGAAGLDAARLAAWIKDSQKQLDIDEQAKLMAAVGVDKGELPEILVHDFRANGYLPEVLLNFLALLGWSPGSDRERMTMDEMVQLFSLDRVHVSNPKFSRDKLLAFNTEFCAAAPLSRLVPAMRDYLAANQNSPLSRASDEQIGRLIEMSRGFRTLRELDLKSAFIFLADDAVTYDASAVEKVLKRNDAEGLTALKDLRPILDRTDWTAAAIEQAVQSYCADKNLGLGKVAQPIRVAISGGTVSPPIFQTLEMLGKDATLRRMDRCVAACGG